MVMNWQRLMAEADKGMLTDFEIYVLDRLFNRISFGGNNPVALLNLNNLH